MLILTDGRKQAINPIYYVIPIPFDRVVGSELNRLRFLASYYLIANCFLIAAALTLSVAYLLGITTTAWNYLSGTFLVYILFRVAARKKVAFRKDQLRVAGKAPQVIVRDHVSLCISFSTIQLTSYFIVSAAEWMRWWFAVLAVAGILSACLPLFVTKSAAL